MRSSFLRLILHRRGALPPNKDAHYRTKKMNLKNKKVKRKYSNHHNNKNNKAGDAQLPNKQQHKPAVPVSPSQVHTSVFAIMAIQAVHESNIMMYNRFHHVYIKGGQGGIMVMMNDYYNKQWNGTLGPSTCSYVVYAWKGERSQSRSRLEVCPANTTSLAASAKPIMYSLTFCQRTYDFVAIWCSETEYLLDLTNPSIPSTNNTRDPFIPVKWYHVFDTTRLVLMNL